jgi:plastocyanin
MKKNLIKFAPLVILTATLGCNTVDVQVDNIPQPESEASVNSSMAIDGKLATVEPDIINNETTKSINADAVKEKPVVINVTTVPNESPDIVSPVEANKDTAATAKSIATKKEPQNELQQQKPATISTAAKTVTERRHNVEPIATKMSFSSSVAITSHSGEVLDSKDIIITMTPLDPSNHKPRTQQAVNIDMVGKTYAPGVAIAALDDKISFINRDSVKHNVFSSSGGNSFDLGTYGRGKSSSVQFSKPGVVKVYCNIHPDMVAFVGVSKSGYSAVTAATGKFTVSSLPPGQYTLNMWSPRGEMTELVNVPATSNKTYTLNVASTFSSQHKNKDGKDYDESSFFDDEFY